MHKHIIGLLGLMFVLAFVPVATIHAQGENFCNMGSTISYGSTISGVISASIPVGIYCFEGESGDTVVINARATDGNLDTFLALTNPSANATYASNDNWNSTTKDSRIVYTLPVDGTYTIGVTSSDFGETGSQFGTYELSLTRTASGQSTNGEDLEEETIDDTDDPEILATYRRDYEQIIEELQNDGVIPYGGSLQFTANQYFYDGSGQHYVPMAEFQPMTNFVLGLELNFRPGPLQDTQLCTVFSRLQESQNIARRYFSFALDEQGDLFLYDLFSDVEDGWIDYAVTELETGENHEFVMIAIDEHVIIYVNGEEVVNVDEVSVREGHFGVGMLSEDRTSHCEAHDIWIYELDLVWDGEEGVCGVTTDQVVNLREGPGTTYPIGGQMQPDTVYDVAGQFDAPDGFVWWQLTDERWVRSDLVKQFGPCESDAPTVTLDD